MYSIFRMRCKLHLFSAFVRFNCPVSRSSSCALRLLALRSLSAPGSSSESVPSSSRVVDAASSLSGTQDAYTEAATPSSSGGLTEPLSVTSPLDTAVSSSASGAAEDIGMQRSSSESSSSSAVSGPGGDVAYGGAEKLEKKDNGMWRALKMVLAGSVIVGVAGSAYVTYAYTTEEIENTRTALRYSAESKVSSDGSLLMKIQGVLYSTTMKAAAKVAEIYLEIRKSIEDQVQGFAAPLSDKLLPDLLPQEQHVFTLVLDLNETLVYTDWKRDRGWRTFKRPGVDAFLEHLAQYYELVIYSDQLGFYVDPILERLDQKGCIRYRLSREATQYIHGKHYRDLSKLNRDPSHVIYLSAHALETCLQPENGVPIKPWKLETDDTTLLDLLPFLEYVARYRPADIRPVLSSYQGHDIPTEFRERTKEYQRKMQELKQQNRFWRGSAFGRSN